MEGVAEKAAFVQGDMYEADISQATVLALFLLPENLTKLTPKFLDLRPGTRIVANHFGIAGWNADETEKVESNCENWCTSLLYIVPAKVAGTWRLPQGELTLEQKFQVISWHAVVGRHEHADCEWAAARGSDQFQRGWNELRGAREWRHDGGQCPRIVESDAGETVEDGFWIAAQRGLVQNDDVFSRPA